MCFHEFAIAFSKQNTTNWTAEKLSYFVQNAPMPEGLIDGILVEEFINNVFARHLLEFLTRTKQELLSLSPKDSQQIILAEMLYLIQDEIATAKEAVEGFLTNTAEPPVLEEWLQ